MRKANVMKKVLAGALALTTTLSLGLMTACGEDELTDEEKEAQAQQEFINEIGGVSETYTGAVSKNNYASADEAAASFVETEIVGEKNVEVVNTAKVADLNATQIAELNIETEETILGVEEYEVEYSEVEAVPYAATAIAPSNTKKVKVYIIKFESHWEYYSPCPVTGETITKSYYDSVFNYEAYKNCTVSMTMEMDINLTMQASGGGESFNQSMTAKTITTQTVQFAENSIYLEYTTKVTSQGQSQEGTMSAYLTMEEGDMICYIKTTGLVGNLNWQQGDLTPIGFTDFEQLTPFYDNYLDYSYFTKTSTGFELSNENADKYVEQTLMKELEDSDTGMDLNTLLGQMGMDIDMFAKYYVSNGILSGMREDITLSMSMNESEGGYSVKMDMNITAVANTKVTNYGTTVVEKPADIVDNSDSAL